MKKLTLFIALLLLSTYSLSAQITINGTIVDEKDQPVGFASVALVFAADSQLVKGALSDTTGAFAIGDVAPGAYQLMTNMLGFETKYTEPFTVTSESKNATVNIRLMPAENLLGEAVVVAKRPLFEQKADRLVMNVADSPIASGGTALEVLKKLPGVLVVRDQVTLAGNNSVAIWIDGKASQYADMNAVLRDMPSDQIDRIELITQPGAQFSAEGGTIINIILKRNANLGFNGTVALTLGGSVYDQSDADSDDKYYHRLIPSLSLNYRKGQWNLFGASSYYNRSTFGIINVDRFIDQEFYAQKGYTPDFTESYSYRVGADFFATEKTTIGVLFRGFTRDNEGRGVNVTKVFDRDQTQQFGAFTTLNNSFSDRSNFLTNLNVKHEFDAKTGHALNFDIDYTEYEISNSSHLRIFQNTPNSPESRSEQRVDQPIRLTVGQVDYTLPIDSTFKMEVGAKSSFAKIDNRLQFLRGEVIDPMQSNDFLYEENINAGYLNLSKKLGVFDFNAGLRAEQTVVSGKTMDLKVLDRNYLQWFPSASALYHVNEHFALQGSYSRRVSRPGFQEQNPFAFFIDSLTYTQGNPKLRPEISNNGQFAVTYDNQPFIRISYSKTDDVIIENAPRLEGTRTFTTAENLAKYERWAFELNFPIQFKKIIDGYGGNQFIRNAYDAEYLDVQYNRAKWNWLAYIQINVSLPADFKFEVGGWYMTNFLEEFFDIGTMGGMSFGVSKTLWDKRGRISLSANDLLYTEKTRVHIDFDNVLVNFFERSDSRNIRLSFSYRFGNTELKSARRRSTGSEDESSRVKVE